MSHRVSHKLQQYNQSQRTCKYLNTCTFLLKNFNQDFKLMYSMSLCHADTARRIIYVLALNAKYVPFWYRTTRRSVSVEHCQKYKDVIPTILQSVSSA